MTNIYVGNLPYNVADAELRDLFAAYGEVLSTQVIMDRVTGQSRGFGFVEMTDDAQAQAAIEALDGRDCEGRSLRVSPARSQSGQRQPRTW